MILGPNQKLLIKKLPEYEKCRGTLCILGMGFCCLGVIADIFDRSDWRFSNNNVGSFKEGNFNIEGTLDKSSLWKRLGLCDGQGTFIIPIRIGDVVYDSLVQVNDACPEAIDHAWMSQFIKTHADNIFKESK